MTRADNLAEYAILDTPSEQSFDDIALIAAQICRTPIALVSLLDRERQWFKARVGLDVSETPIDQSVCQIDIEQPAMLVVPDLTADPRTNDNPLVTGERAFRFYAGAPLVADDGIAIGRLCVIDYVARPEGLSADQSAALLALGRQVVVLLDQNRATRVSEDAAQLQATLVAVGERIRESESVADMTYGVAEIVGRALDAQRAGFGTIDADVQYVTIEPDWTAGGNVSIAGTHRFEDFGQIRDELASGEPLIIHDVTTDPRTASDPGAMLALGIGALVNMPVKDRGRAAAAFIVHFREAHRWTRTELTFLRSVADRLEAGVARFRAAAQQDVLNHEISHRLKNTLAMVQAIASQTLRRVGDRAAIENFERRLLALSTAHDVLMQSNWSSAGLAEVLDGVLASFGHDSRITRAGPPVELGPRAALSLALLAHELVTNAAKYGALSVPEGRVTISWRTQGIAPDGTLRVEWRERGGPLVTPPTEKGFGSKLIRLGLTGTGGVDLRYNELGLEADMSAALGELAYS